MVNAPTGYGKSVTAIAVARMLESEGAKTTVLVHRKFLQQQYMDLNYEEGSPILQATGRANWNCILPDYVDKTADQAPCTEGFHCPHKNGGCPYYDQRNAADRNNIRILNYPLFFENVRVGAKNEAPESDEDLYTDFAFFRHNRIIICDEGHKVDKEILNVVSTTITTKDFALLKNFGITMPRIANLSLKHNPHVLDWARHAHNLVQSDIRRIESDPLYKRATDTFTTSLVNTRKNQLTKVGRKLIKILDLEKYAAAIQYEHNGSLQFRPVLSEQWAQPLLLQHAQKVVLMSATIFNAPYWADRLGIDEDEIEYIEIPSTFPKENRPIYFSPVARVNYKIWSNPDELNKLVDHIDRIIEASLPHKGVIHTGNRRLALAIQEGSKFRQLMHVGGAEVLDQFKESTIGVLVSYSATEGVDLPDDLCRFTIFAKVPWLPKDDPVIRLQMEEIPNFYEYEAASEIVQGVGRGMRHENDWCINYILDASFKMLKSKTWAMLPDWFKESYGETGIPPLPVRN